MHTRRCNFIRRCNFTKMKCQPCCFVFRGGCLSVTKRRNGGNRCSSTNTSGKPQKAHSKTASWPRSGCYILPISIVEQRPSQPCQHRPTAQQLSHWQHECPWRCLKQSNLFSDSSFVVTKRRDGFMCYRETRWFSDC